MENINGRLTKVKKYSHDESKKMLQKYAIDIASGVGSNIQDIDVLEYITCLSEDDRYTFKNLEKKIRNRIIDDILDDNILCCTCVRYTVKEGIRSSLRNMSSDDLIKLVSIFPKVNTDSIIDMINENLKKLVES